MGRAASRPREDGGRGLRPVQQQPLEPHAPRRDSCPGARECSGSPAKTGRIRGSNRIDGRLPFKSEGGLADGTRVGSRLGTHALWTIALSVVITLLALAPLVLPGDRPLDSLPAPLRGTAQAGEIVA